MFLRQRASRDTAVLQVTRDAEGKPIVEPLIRGGHPRITTASSIRTDYAAHYDDAPGADPVWLAGAKSLRLVPAGTPGLIAASDFAAAMADLLVVVDVFLIQGRKVSLGGLPFPHLAFDEMVEAILLWPVIVSVDPQAIGTVDVIDLCFFHPGEAYVDLVAALLARDWARFVVELVHRCTDPVWATFQRSRFPGHADLFLANVRRLASSQVSA